MTQNTVKGIWLLPVTLDQLHQTQYDMDLVEDK